MLSMISSRSVTDGVSLSVVKSNWSIAESVSIGLASVCLSVCLSVPQQQQQQHNISGASVDQEPAASVRCGPTVRMPTHVSLFTFVALGERHVTDDLVTEFAYM